MAAAAAAVAAALEVALLDALKSADAAAATASAAAASAAAAAAATADDELAFGCFLTFLRLLSLPDAALTPGVVLDGASVVAALRLLDMLNLDWY